MNCKEVVVNLTERELVRLAKSKRPCYVAAFGSLYQENYPEILKIVEGKVGSKAEAEQIAQDVFLLMLENLHTYRPKPNKPLLAWLTTIAIHEIAHFYGQWKDGEEWDSYIEVGIEGLEEIIPAEIEDTTKVTTTTTSEQLMALANKHLSPYLFGVFKMTDEGDTASEIGERLGKKEGTIKKARHDARLKLQEVAIAHGLVDKRDDGTYGLKSFGILFLLRSLGDTPHYDSVQKLGKLIQSTRRAKGLTPEALASNANLSQEALSALEHGLLWAENIKPDWIASLEQSLNIDLHGELNQALEHSKYETTEISRWPAIRSGLSEYRWLILFASALFVTGVFLLVRPPLARNNPLSDGTPTVPGQPAIVTIIASSPIVVSSTPTVTLMPTLNLDVAVFTSTPTPPVVTQCQPDPPPGWVVYVIQSGDTLYNLALATGATVENVQEVVENLRIVNCIEIAQQIFAGQNIWLPVLPPTPTPTPTPTFTPAPTPVISFSAGVESATNWYLYWDLKNFAEADIAGKMPLSGTTSFFLGQYVPLLSITSESGTYWITDSIHVAYRLRVVSLDGKESYRYICKVDNADNYLYDLHINGEIPCP